MKEKEDLEIKYEERDSAQPWRVYSGKQIVWFAKTREEAKKYIEEELCKK